jgi:hypothetical protein
MSPWSRRKRHFSSVALACVVIVLFASCKGSDKHASPSTVPATDAKGEPKVSLALKLGSLKVDAVGPAKPFNRAAAREILKLVNAYIDRGIARPLFTGSTTKSLERYFAKSLAKRVGRKGHDRDALTDEHSPVLTGVSKVVKQPLALAALENQGRLVMIGARFGLSVTGATEQGPLAINRLGYFVFEPDSKHVFHITGYTIVVQRDDARSSTTAKATTTTAAK